MIDSKYTKIEKRLHRIASRYNLCYGNGFCSFNETYVKVSLNLGKLNYLLGLQRHNYCKKVYGTLTL